MCSKAKQGDGPSWHRQTDGRAAHDEGQKPEKQAAASADFGVGEQQPQLSGRPVDEVMRGSSLLAVTEEGTRLGQPLSPQQADDSTQASVDQQHLQQAECGAEGYARAPLAGHGLGREEGGTHTKKSQVDVEHPPAGRGLRREGENDNADRKQEHAKAPPAGQDLGREGGGAPTDKFQIDVEAPPVGKGLRREGEEDNADRKQEHVKAPQAGHGLGREGEGEGHLDHMEQEHGNPPMARQSIERDEGGAPTEKDQADLVGPSAGQDLGREGESAQADKAHADSKPPSAGQDLGREMVGAHADSECVHADDREQEHAKAPLARHNQDNLKAPSAVQELGREGERVHAHGVQVSGSIPLDDPKFEWTFPLSASEK
eukprot:gene5362-5579_t